MYIQDISYLHFFIPFSQKFLMHSNLKLAIIRSLSHTELNYLNNRIFLIEKRLEIQTVIIGLVVKTKTKHGKTSIMTEQLHF